MYWLHPSPSLSPTQLSATWVWIIGCNHDREQNYRMQAMIVEVTDTTLVRLLGMKAYCSPHACLFTTGEALISTTKPLQLVSAAHPLAT